MKRREFLKISSGFSAHALVGGSLLSGLALRRAEADTGLPLAQLQSMIDPTQALILVPTDARYKSYNMAFNLRTQLSPQIRVVAASVEAVQATVSWAAANGVSFALRGGGHSYEGYSQSRSVVIDSRGMNQISVDASAQTVTVGSGVALGDVYKALAPYGMAIPAGSCFPVGVSGHSLGGGFGLLSRPYGLACDNILSLKMVDAQSQALNLSDTENPDLFWAMRGAGNGNFGVATEFTFQTHAVGNVADFGITWVRPVDKAVAIFQTWQSALASMPDAITCTLHLSRAPGGKIKVHVAGQTIDTETALKAELARWEKAAGAADQVRTSTKTFLESAMYFNGLENGYEQVIMKAKSDYIVDPLSAVGARALMVGLLNAPIPMAVMCDSYGGAINRLAEDAMAFAHRGSTKCSMQYYVEWSNPASTPGNLKAMNDLYAVMRPYVSGGAYVNYCDLDLPADVYPTAYWGANLPRLMDLKKQFDPGNLFTHAQGIPLA